MRRRCDVGTRKSKSTLNKDEERSSKNIHTYSLRYVLRGGGREKCFCFWNVRPCYSYAKWRKWDIWVQPWGGIFWRHRQTGVFDRLGGGHQSCNSCEQSWGLERAVLRRLLLKPPPRAPSKCASSTSWCPSEGPHASGCWGLQNVALCCNQTSETRRLYWVRRKQYYSVNKRIGWT